MKRYILAGVLFCIPIAAYAITTNFSITVAISALTSVFSCPSGFSSTNPCGVFFTTGSDNGGNFIVLGSLAGSTPALSGSAVNLVPSNANHVAINMNWRSAKVNVGQFSTTFTFVPNGMNLAFILNNSNNNPTFNGVNFSAGAGCEAAFFQGFAQTAPPNNVFALDIDQHDSTVAGGTTFTNSSVQYYDTGHAPPNAPNAPGQSPCNPDLGTDMSPGVYTYVGVNKIPTSPVAMNNPANNQGIVTGHTYSVTISYDGSNLTTSIFDVTAGGACPGAACFTNTWPGVNIPTIVGGSTAWVGLGSGTGSGGTQIPPVPLLINSWTLATN